MGVGSRALQRRTCHSRAADDHPALRAFVNLPLHVLPLGKAWAGELSVGPGSSRAGRRTARPWGASLRPGRSWRTAQAARPGQLAALPGTVLPIRLPRALALLLVLLIVVKLLDAVLVADLQQVGIGLWGQGRRVRWATCPQRTPTPSSGRGSSRCRRLHSGRK